VIERCTSEKEAREFVNVVLVQYEEKTTKETVVSSLKFLWASKVKGEFAEAPKKEFLTFSQVVAQKFE
jgi:hypothetical protein